MKATLSMAVAYSSAMTVSAQGRRSALANSGRLSTTVTLNSSILPIWARQAPIWPAPKMTSCGAGTRGSIKTLMPPPQVMPMSFRSWVDQARCAAAMSFIASSIIIFSIAPPPTVPAIVAVSPHEHAGTFLAGGRASRFNDGGKHHGLIAFSGRNDFFKNIHDDSPVNLFVAGHNLFCPMQALNFSTVEARISGAMQSRNKNFDFLCHDTHLLAMHNCVFIFMAA